MRMFRTLRGLCASKRGLMDEVGAYYLTDVHRRFRSLKALADHAMAQAEEDFFTVLAAQDNSIAIIVKHMSGNMRSRWRDFLHSDGEKPERDRDREFIVQESQEVLLVAWEAGWTVLFRALDSLEPHHLLQSVTIRGELHTVLEAISRQLSHYAYHVGQIVLLAKHFCGEMWRSLSIPKGKSEAFNQTFAKHQT